MDLRLKLMKQKAIDFYQMAFDGQAEEAVRLYAGDHYIQHNPLVGNGLKPFVEYFDRMYKEFPNKSIRFVRCIAEDDLVALHTHQIWPDGDQYVTMDFFRFDENERIVEHWDSMQEIPEHTENGNTMF